MRNACCQQHNQQQQQQQQRSSNQWQLQPIRTTGQADSSNIGSFSGDRLPPCPLSAQPAPRATVSVGVGCATPNHS